MYNTCIIHVQYMYNTYDLSLYRPRFYLQGILWQCSQQDNICINLPIRSKLYFLPSIFFLFCFYFNIKSKLSTYSFLRTSGFSIFLFKGFLSVVYHVVFAWTSCITKKIYMFKKKNISIVTVWKLIKMFFDKLRLVI